MCCQICSCIVRVPLLYSLTANLFPISLITPIFLLFPAGIAFLACVRDVTTFYETGMKT